MSGKDPSDYATCPYNRSHELLKLRLITHIERCSKQCANANKLLICPLNQTHRVKSSDMKSHVLSCENRSTVEKYAHPDKLPQPQAKTFQHPIESEENWDDDEDVKTYDPTKHCENNLVVRKIYSEPPSVRKQFRDSERRRFANGKK